jgi:tRNA(adenine34) deaminase
MAHHLSDLMLMRLAMEEGARALESGDIPVGAIAVHRPTGAIIGRGHNQRERDADPVAHAEVLALQAAARTLGRWRLDDVCLVCTLEPCPMCAGAMLQAKLNRLVYGALDPKAGAAGSVVDLLRDPRLPHRVDVFAGVLADETAAQLHAFFAHLREGRAHDVHG